jgi:hypothetical protein
MLWDAVFSVRLIEGSSRPPSNKFLVRLRCSLPLEVLGIDPRSTKVSPKKYFPQYIESVHVWQSVDHEDNGKTGERFFLSLGNSWGCASTWHDVHWKLWRMDSLGTKLLIDDSHLAWLRTGQHIIGSVGARPIISQ